MLRRINLKSELQIEQEKLNLNQQELLLDCYAILGEEQLKDNALLGRLKKHSSADTIIQTPLIKQNIFTINEIHNVCTDYRLRFLETKYLRYPLPYEALVKIKEFEKQHQVEIKQFSIMAPAESFKLDRKTDPLLFAHLGNNRYYLIHQWGSDLVWYRRLLMLPLRNLYTLVGTIVLLSFVSAFLIPKEWIVSDKNFYPLLYNFRMFLFFLLSTGSMGIAFYIGITRNKDFSEDAWNSKWI